MTENPGKVVTVGGREALEGFPGGNFVCEFLME